MEVSKAEGKGECKVQSAECRISLPLEGKVLNESEADEVEIPENIDGNTSSVSLRLPPSPRGRLVGSGSARPK